MGKTESIFNCLQSGPKTTAQVEKATGLTPKQIHNLLKYHVERGAIRRKDERWHFKGFMRGYASHIAATEQALNHTPDTGKMADHIGDANKMVRLTDEFLIETYLLCKAEWKATNKRQRERIAVMFGKAVMDAMIAKNGGSHATD